MHNKTEASPSQNRKRLSPIEELPTALHHHRIFPYLSEQDLGRFATLSKKLQQAYYNSPSQKEASEKLLTHVVKGKEEQALQMLDANPTLLLYTSNATDYSERTYNNYTPFQAALLCHDVTLWKKMESCFDRLPDGQTEKARQFNALFPEGIPQGTPYDFSALIQTITMTYNRSPADIDAVLQKTQNDTEICQALNRFRSEFKALAMRETFFNPSHLIEALKAYDEQFNHWSGPQRDLFWRQVIGYTQRFLPARLAEAFVKEVDLSVEKHTLFARSLKLRPGMRAFFPLVDDSSGLGFDFGINAQVGRQSSAKSGRRRPFEKLCRSNTVALKLLEFELSEQHEESVTDNYALTSLS